MDPWGLEAYNPARDVAEIFRYFILGQTLGGENTLGVDRAPRDRVTNDPLLLLDDFTQRRAKGDHTRGLAQARTAAAEGIAGGREAVRWGGLGGSFAPGAGGMLASGAILALDGGEGDSGGVLVGALGVAAGIRGIKANLDDAGTLAGRDLANRAEVVEYFSSFRSLKHKLGPAGEGKVWHHIVEQSQLPRFGAEAIHNTSNVVAVPREVNIKLNALYSSIRPEITGAPDMTVRQWLSTKPIDEARGFGLDAINRVMQGTWP